MDRCPSVRETPGRSPRGLRCLEVCVYALSCRLGSFIIFASLLSVVVLVLEARSIQKVYLRESRREVKAVRPEASGAGGSFMFHPIDGVDEREEEKRRRSCSERGEDSLGTQSAEH